MAGAALSFLVSAVICGAIVYLRPYHQRYSIDAISTFSQKIHAKATLYLAVLCTVLVIPAVSVWDGKTAGRVATSLRRHAR